MLGVVAVALKQLLAAGVTGDALVTAVAEIENAAHPPRSTAAERQARYRERRASQSVTCDASPLDKEIPPTPPKEIKPLSQTKQICAREFREAFWPAYPHKVGKPVALKAFIAARQKDDLETIMDGLRRYVRTKPPDRSWCNPATWLNQERWNDEPAAESPSNAKPESGHDRILRTLAEISEERAAARGGSMDPERSTLGGPEDGPDQSGRILELAAQRASQ